MHKYKEGDKVYVVTEANRKRIGGVYPSWGGEQGVQYTIKKRVYHTDTPLYWLEEIECSWCEVWLKPASIVLIGGE